MDKEDVARIYNGYYSAKQRNEIELFVVRWMDLESVIQSEVRKRKKILSANTYIRNQKKKKKRF